MLLVGLTGGIGTGKSTVAKVFVDFGAKLVDLDQLARVVVEPGKEGLDQLVREFGHTILCTDGSLDRVSLSKRVFSNTGLRKRLEEILHPFIESEMHRRVEELMRADPGVLVLVDIPLLFEVGWEDKFEKVVLVHAPPHVQVKRIMARDGLSEEEARKRLLAQMPIDEKIPRSDFVIRNGGSIQETRAQVARVVEQLHAMARGGSGIKAARQDR